MIHNIKNNTISEADTKKKINELNEIKKAEIKDKRLIKSQEKLLSLFGDLVEAILNNNNNNNNNNDDNNKNNNNDKDLSENVSENESKNVSENESENENDDDDDEFY